MNDTKSRSRMSLTVDDELARLIERAKRESGEATASKTLRWALKKAIKPPPPVTLALDVIKWAEDLAFPLPRERRELRELVRRMYEQLRVE